MPRFFKSLVPALLAISLIMQGVFLPLLQAYPAMSKPDDIASLFDLAKHDAKKSQHKEHSCNADDQDDGHSKEKENVSWQVDFCGVFYHSLALPSFSELFPVESIHRLMSPVSGIFRPPRA
jgi:hypothetical protein